MEFIRSNKMFLLICILCIGGVVGIYYYMNQGNSSTVLTSTPTPSGTSGADLLTALSNLQQVKLNNAIFTDQVFVSLTDFGVDIPAQPVGRQNPFAPIGSVNSGATSLGAGSAAVVPASQTGTVK